MTRISKQFLIEAEKLLPDNNYIGLSITQGNEYRKKSWPLENFIELAKKIQKIKKIPVFFLEKANREIAKKLIKDSVNLYLPNIDKLVNSNKIKDYVLL